MWTPPERIKHALPEVRWPSAEEAARSRWFSPVRIGPLEARQRTWVPAMVPWRATDDGMVTPEVLDWYGRFADGRPGVIVVEATGIRDVPSGPLLRVGHDRFLEGLRRLVDVVKHRSHGETLLFLQAIDFLRITRRPTRDKFYSRYLLLGETHREALARIRDDERWLSAPDDDVRRELAALDDAQLPDVLDARELESLERGYRERVTDLHLPHIRELPRVLPELFAGAAARALSAGFDGVELHYAHAYTMASFLSAKNTRTDGYGGAAEDRVRLPLAVYAAARSALGPKVALGCRFLSDEVIEGGSHVEDARYFAARFAEAGMDFLSL